MTRIKQLMAALCRRESREEESVEDIAQMMKPVDQSMLQLPWTFAHAVRLILDEEPPSSDESAPQALAGRGR